MHSVRGHNGNRRELQPTAMHNVMNFACFQLVWFGCVLGTAAGWSLLGPALLAVWLPLHLHLSAVPRADLLLALGGLLAGTALDTGYQLAGLLQFAGVTLMEPLAPLWISALWVAFLLTLNHSLRWLQGRPGLALLFGALGGPVSYWAGVRLGAAEALAAPWLLYGVIATVWGLVMLSLACLPIRREQPA